MKLNDEQVKFLQAGLSDDPDRENLQVMWADPELGAAFSANGFVLHATKADAGQCFAFRPLQYDGRTELSLDDMDPDKKLPCVLAIDPGKPRVSMQISRSLLLKVLQAMPIDGWIQITICGEMEHTRDGKILVLQSEHDDQDFYALIMGMYHDSLGKKPWSPFDASKE